MSTDPFGLRDDEYWQDPWRTRRTVQRALIQSGEEGIVLGTPATVALNAQKTFPAALIRVAKLPTFERLPTHGLVVLVAADLHTGALRAALALVARPPAPAAPAATPAAKDSFSDDPTAMIGEGHTFDLAALLGLPAARREYLVNAILLDNVSNRARMKVVEAGGYDDPAVDDFLRERMAAKAKLPEIQPPEGDPLPSYKPGEDSLPVPDAPGITLSVPRVSAIGPDEQCVVRGSFRLPVLPQHVVKPPKAEKGQPPPPPPEDKARIPINLLLTGSVDHAPKVVKLVVPCYEPLVEADGVKLALGHFAFDLSAHPEMKVSPQTYFIYVFTGALMVGPFPAAFVELPPEEPEAVGNSF